MPGKYRKIIGYLLLAISALAALAIAVLPFLGVTLAEGAVIALALVVVAEVGYFAGLALAGRDLWRRLRAWLEEVKRQGPRE